jgi:hypothetical protein
MYIIRKWRVPLECESQTISVIRQDAKSARTEVDN